MKIFNTFTHVLTQKNKKTLLFNNLFLIIVCLLIPLLSFPQTDSGYLDIGEYKLYYKIFGDKGKPILIINGGPGFSSNYLDEFAQMMAVDMKRQVILFDQRGTGKTVVKPITKKTVSLKASLDDIEALRLHLNIKKWDIIGHAYGGALAMMYARDYPENINKLVLSSSIGMNFDFVDPMLANLKVRLSLMRQEELKELSQRQVEGKITPRQFYKQRFDMLAEAYVFDQTQVPKAREIIKHETDFNYEVNQVIWDQLKVYGYDLTEAMSKFNHPVLILHGRQDVIGESIPIFTQSIFPNSELIFINEAGRYLWLDKPEEYFSHLRKFL